MEHAFVAAKRSTCSRGQVGVVFSHAGRILVSGYNGAPARMIHCNHECNCGYPGDGGLLFQGRHLSSCNTLQPCTVSVHAEANAIAFAAKHGICLDDSSLFTTFTPCRPCAQLLVNVGVVIVYAAQLYRDPSGAELLKQAGIEVIDWKNETE